MTPPDWVFISYGNKKIIFGIIGITILYLLFAFANVSFNLNEWTVYDRGLCATFMGMVVVCVFIAHIIDNSNKK